MIKYRLIIGGSAGKYEIKPIEITKETSNYIYLEQGNNKLKAIATNSPMEAWRHWFDAWGEAKKYAIWHAEWMIREYADRLDEAEEHLKTAKNLTPHLVVIKK